MAVLTAMALLEPVAGAAEPRLRLPKAAALRPTTTPRDHFEVRFSAGVRAGDALPWEAPLGAGARYGLTDEVEIGLRLLRLTLAEASSGAGGLASPTALAAARLPLGPLEIGGLVEVDIPVDGFDLLDVGVFARLHVQSVARLDLGARMGGRFAEGTRFPLRAPAEVLFSLGDSLALGGGAVLASSDLAGEPDLWVQPTAQLLLTLGRLSAPPLVDVGLRFEGPSLRLRGEDRPIGLAGLVTLSLFFDDPDTGQSDPW